jgi:hypothetical protein
MQAHQPQVNNRQLKTMKQNTAQHNIIIVIIIIIIPKQHTGESTPKKVQKTAILGSKHTSGSTNVKE